MSKKNILKVFIATFIISVGIMSCQKDDSSDPSALDRDKFLGTWKVISQGSESGKLNWDMTISASNSSTSQILIKNFDAQVGTTTVATVNGSSFSISFQTIGSEDVMGSGTYSNGTLTFSYTADDGQKVDDVNATATK